MSIYVMEPPSMVSRNVAQRRSVDLPEPDGPMMLTTSPFSTDREMSFRTSFMPPVEAGKLLFILFISNIIFDNPRSVDHLPV